MDRRKSPNSPPSKATQVGRPQLLAREDSVNLSPKLPGQSNRDSVAFGSVPPDLREPADRAHRDLHARVPAGAGLDPASIDRREPQDSLAPTQSPMHANSLPDDLPADLPGAAPLAGTAAYDPAQTAGRSAAVADRQVEPSPRSDPADPTGAPGPLPSPDNSTPLTQLEALSAGRPNPRQVSDEEAQKAKAPMVLTTGPLGKNRKLQSQESASQQRSKGGGARRQAPKTVGDGPQFVDSKPPGSSLASEQSSAPDIAAQPPIAKQRAGNPVAELLARARQSGKPGRTPQDKDPSSPSLATMNTPPQGDASDGQDESMPRLKSISNRGKTEHKVARAGIVEDQAAVLIDGFTTPGVGNKADLTGEAANLHLRVAMGELVGIAGVSGKTAVRLFQAILGLQKLKDGSAFSLGKQMPKERPLIQSQIGWLRLHYAALRQEPWPLLGARADCIEILRHAARLNRRQEPKETAQRIAELCGLTGALPPNFAWELPYRVRLRTALCLVSNPELLLLDFPTRDLGVEDAAWVWSVLEQFQDDTGATILLTSNSLEELERLCDRVVLLDKGQTHMDTAPGTIAQRVGRETLVDQYLKPADSLR